MLFKFDGREFDTDKPIYMLGYCIKDKDSWFPVDLGRDRAIRYPMHCKKLYVKSLTFADLNYKHVSTILTSPWRFHKDFFPSLPRAEPENFL